MCDLEYFHELLFDYHGTFFVDHFDAIAEAFIFLTLSNLTDNGNPCPWFVSMEKLYFRFVITLISGVILCFDVFGHNKKPAHDHPHPPAGKGVPEIDGNELLMVFSVLILSYLMYFYWRNNLRKSPI